MAHSLPLGPGPLRFDASFESGNLAEARLVSDMPCAP